MIIAGFPLGTIVDSNEYIYMNIVWFPGEPLKINGYSYTVPSGKLMWVMPWGHWPGCARLVHMTMCILTSVVSYWTYNSTHKLGIMDEKQMIHLSCDTWPFMGCENGEW